MKIMVACSGGSTYGSWDEDSGSPMRKREEMGRDCGGPLWRKRCGVETSGGWDGNGYGLPFLFCSHLLYKGFFPCTPHLVGAAPVYWKERCLTSEVQSGVYRIRRRVDKKSRLELCSGVNQVGVVLLRWASGAKKTVIRVRTWPSWTPEASGFVIISVWVWSEVMSRPAPPALSYHGASAVEAFSVYEVFSSTEIRYQTNEDQSKVSQIRR